MNHPITKRLHRSSPSSPEPLEARIAPASFQVINLNDSGAGSLRDALDRANALAGSDTIVFAPGLHGTIVLASQLTVTDTVSISGPGPEALTISGNDQVRVFDMETAGKSLTVESLTVAHGSTAAKGGGIFVRGGSLVLRDSVVTENKSTNRGGGIALYSGPGSLVIQDTVISNNQATSRGGGIFLYNITGAEVRIENTIVSGNSSSNRGGGMFLYKVATSSFTVSDSTVTQNHADTASGRGGGLSLYKVSTPLQIKRTTISENTSGLVGGGMFFYKCTGSTLIEDSTISENVSATGGGIHLKANTFALTFRQTTISGNSVTGNNVIGDGGAIKVESVTGANSLTLQNSTVFGNKAAFGIIGGLSTPGIDILLQSTIVAGSTSGGVLGADLAGTFRLDHSLVQTVGTAAITDLGGNILGQDPKLSPLGDHGGQVQTHEPLRGSPALNAGSNPVGLDFDARGTGAKRVVGLTDIGAVELQGGILVAAPGIGKAPTNDLVVTNLATGSSSTITAYPKKVRDALHVAVADFNDDGFDDVLVTTDHGKGPIKIFNGLTGEEIVNSFTGLNPLGGKKGSFVTTAQLPNGDTQVIFGSTKGGGGVRVFDAATGNPGEIFFPFGRGYKGGVQVSAGDINGDGLPDLVAAQNTGNKVAVFSAIDPAQPLVSFTVGAKGYRGGVSVAVGDLNGEGSAEIVTGHLKGKPPTVEVWKFQPAADPDPASEVKLGEFLAFDEKFPRGVHVALADFNLDGKLDIVSASGPKNGSKLRVFDGLSFITTPETPTQLTEVIVYPDDLNAEIWVAGSV